VQGLSSDGEKGTAGVKVPEQMEMFRPPEEILMEELRRLDTSQMTPLEALNTLDTLCRKAHCR
jgi:hypothetical protein